MNTPETRSDKHTGPSLRHRTHPGNPGLNTDSLGGRDREYGHVCIAFVFGWYIVLANTPTMHKNNSGLADRQRWCNNLHVFAQMSSAAGSLQRQKRQKWAERDS